MMNFKRMCALVLALTMVFALAACGGGEVTGGDPTESTDSTAPTESTGTQPTNPTNPTDPTDPAPGKKTYTVSIATEGGMVMAGINVYVYADEALTDMKAAGSTDEDGCVSFEMTEGTYYVQLQGVATGYDVQNYYTFTDSSLVITLNSELVQGESVEGHIFKVGDVMYDFSFEDNSTMICPNCGALNDTYIRQEDGSGPSRLDCAECGGDLDWNNPQFVTYTLSEVLAEKELVVLNFWYASCSNCVTEFPILNEAYQMYSEDVAVLGLNSYILDDMAGAMTFEGLYGVDLDFPLGKVSNSFAPGNFINPQTGEGAAGYPTSVFVDRYGVICAIEVGAMTSLTQWASVFGHFVGDDYEQKLVTSLDQLIVRMEPTYDMPTDEEIIDAAVSGDFTVSFHGEPDDNYAWPFIVTEKDGVTCLKASNQKIYESYAILYADVYMEAGQVFGFDYFASSESGGDYLHVIVDGEAIYTISGINDEWKSAYCWVAPVAGTYEIALCYIKDSSTDEGEDTFYIDNMRIVTEADIDSPSYIPHQGAVKQDDGSFVYADLYYNEKDGYYHVGSENGPLLLANLMGYTQLFEDDFVYSVALYQGFVLDGVDYLEALTPYCTAANNSSLTGYCTVTKELADLLQKFTKIYGINGDEEEWLKLCKYYSAYGTNGQQLEDPIQGLTWYSAFEAVLGEGYVDENGEGQNFFFYDGRLIVPRGLWARFVPNKSGVYRITTTYNDFASGLDAWIFNRDGEIIYNYEGSEMLHYVYADGNNITMVFYMEAGVDYYIDIAPYIGEAANRGYVIYDVEYVSTEFDLFTACSPGPFTYDEVSGQTMIRGIDVALADDGFYHEVLERDENGNPVRFGSVVYAYFTGATTLFSQSIEEMIELRGFDFTMSEYDLEIMAYLNMHDGDIEATEEYLRELWGSDYETYAEIYQLEDVFAGRYHGEPGAEDLTDEIKTYLSKIIDSETNPELNGCVAVDARLAELLHMLMDKYTFEDVDDSWQKLCYYYQYLGPQG